MSLLIYLSVLVVATAALAPAARCWMQRRRHWAQLTSYGGFVAADVGAVIRGNGLSGDFVVTRVLSDHTVQVRMLPPRGGGKSRALGWDLATRIH